MNQNTTKVCLQCKNQALYKKMRIAVSSKDRKSYLIEYFRGDANTGPFATLTTCTPSREARSFHPFYNIILSFFLEKLKKFPTATRISLCVRNSSILKVTVRQFHSGIIFSVSWASLSTESSSILSSISLTITFTSTG